MLDIAKRNVKSWYGDKVKFEGYVRDITSEQFDDLIVSDMLEEDVDQTINIILLLGDTPMNFPAYSDAYRPIINSMHRNDLFIQTLKPDTESSRRYFDLGSSSNSAALAPDFKVVLDLLNIDESLYEPEFGFDSEKKMRYVRVRLKTAIRIQFDLGGTKKRELSLEKGETILLCRIWHLQTSEIIVELKKAGFALLHASLTEDRQYFISISSIEGNVDDQV